MAEETEDHHKASGKELVSSSALRRVLIVLGSIFVALGAIGVFLPVMPTTPFLLLAAACYARASPAFYNRLLNSPGFGPLIREYRESGSIPVRAKILAVLMINSSIGVSAYFFVPIFAVKISMVCIGLCVSAWIVTRPSRPVPTDE